jgi:hypothetical protein
MPMEVNKFGDDLRKTPESGALSGIYDVILLVAVLGFSAVALLALALAAPLAIAVSAVAGAASAFFAGSGRRGGWRAANSV